MLCQNSQTVIALRNPSETICCYVQRHFWLETVGNWSRLSRFHVNYGNSLPDSIDTASLGSDSSGAPADVTKFGKAICGSNILDPNHTILPHDRSWYMDMNNPRTCDGESYKKR